MWINTAAAFTVLGLIAYAVLAGADFGGGVWDLFATGPRKDAQRAAIKHAMGPVWEANHVWLIYVIVMLFTCFPNGFTNLATELFIPLHLALVGIMLRGAAFVFRGYKRKKPTLPGETLHEPVWSSIFGFSSVIAPFLLGTTFGWITAGVANPTVHEAEAPWLTDYCIYCGLLAVFACSFLAAVYLCTETKGDVQNDFRRRAILAGTATAILAGVVLLVARSQAHRFFDRLFSPAAAPVIVAGLLFFALSAWSVLTRRYKLARIFAAGEVTLLIIGWAVAHYPFFSYPRHKLLDVAGPVATIQFMVIATPIGLALVVPSMLLLFKVFFEKETEPS
jgi:cytochrome d ubiquinol oxidase subunit II